MVVTGGRDGRVCALGAEEGTEQWSVDVADIVEGAPSGIAGIASSPAVSDGLAYVGSPDHGLYAIDSYPIEGAF